MMKAALKHPKHCSCGNSRARDMKQLTCTDQMHLLPTAGQNSRINLILHLHVLPWAEIRALIIYHINASSRGRKALTKARIPSLRLTQVDAIRMQRP